VIFLYRMRAPPPWHTLLNGRHAPSVIVRR
jgi:hypothetical protein